MVRERCTAHRANGEPCQAFALPGGAVCWSHDPGNGQAVKDAQRKGGANRATYRRAAKHWAAAGDVIPQDDLPAFLRAAIIDVREGRLEPAVASAIATLAKTAVQLTAELEMEKRISALEAAAGMNQGTQLRRVK